MKRGEVAKGALKDREEKEEVKPEETAAWKGMPDQEELGAGWIASQATVSDP